MIGSGGGSGDVIHTNRKHENRHEKGIRVLKQFSSLETKKMNGKNYNNQIYSNIFLLKEQNGNDCTSVFSRTGTVSSVVYCRSKPKTRTLVDAKNKQ